MADINSPAEFIKEAEAALAALGGIKEELRNCADARDKKEAELENLKRRIEKEKDTTLKDRRSSIENEYGKQLKAVENDIKTVSEKRAKAREQGVRERIAEQTKGLKEEVSELTASWKNAVKDNRLPSFCRTRLYYTLFMPKGAGEYLKAVLAALILILGIPFAVYKLAGFESALWLIIFILLAVIVSGGVYLMIAGHTIGRNKQGVIICRDILDRIKADESQIRAITRSIKDDKGDALYDLHEYDDELSRKNLERDNINAKLNDALIRFDNVTKTVLIDEIDARFAEKLAAVSSESRGLAAKCAGLAKAVSESEIALNNDYTQYIGSRNMTSARLEQMAGMIERGEAEGISDAASKI